MNFDVSVLDSGERMKYALRSLYMKNGYQRYRMSKFEEYDFYSRNKSFLVSEGIITFTDTNGRLMALKPDVTLSIIKNTSDSSDVQRLCYDENVYRVSGSERVFREITQTGIECIGDIGAEEAAQVLRLAEQSLAALSPNYILEISDLDIVSAFVKALGVETEAEEEIMKLAAQKNLHEIKAACERFGADGKAARALSELLSISDRPCAAFDKLRKLACDNGQIEKFEALKSALAGVDDDHLCLDFSLSGNLSYYNGIVFKGYIEGIPESVLSGGRYDRLMKKLGRSSKAIGFAVYLDRLGRLSAAVKGGADEC